ncbi:MAG: hypothetical protein NVS3B20_14850 [Polyangiales bacterium]
MRLTSKLLVALIPSFFSGLLFMACGSVAEPSLHGMNPDGGRDASRDFGCTPADTAPFTDGGAVGGRCNCTALAVARKVGGACNALVREYPYEGGEHHEPGTPIIYCTNPPSSGPHYSIWAAFTTYEKPVPAGFLVHDMEHGAVVLWYRCAAPFGCTEVAKQLQSIIDARPIDPLCVAPVKRRMILVPDPNLPTAIAASAHTVTYQADCVDPVSLNAFIDQHYGHGPEDLCGDGIDPLPAFADAGDAAAE